MAVKVPFLREKEISSKIFLSSYEKPAYSKAVNECPLLVLLQQADQFASFMMEHMVDPKIENLIE